METYTSQTDNMYQEANKIEYPDYISPYTCCYESLLEFEEIIVKAREIESTGRDIQKSFKKLPVRTADTFVVAVEKSDC